MTGERWLEGVNATRDGGIVMFWGRLIDIGVGERADRSIDRRMARLADLYNIEGSTSGGQIRIDKLL